MYKLCKTEQSAKRQREIEGALFDLLMKKSYSDITVTEICDVLSMPRKAFYRYFDSKDDTLYALIEHTMAEYNDFPAKARSGRSGAKSKNILPFGRITSFFLMRFTRITCLKR